MMNVLCIIRIYVIMRVNMTVILRVILHRKHRNFGGLPWSWMSTKIFGRSKELHPAEVGQHRGFRYPRTNKYCRKRDA